VIDDRNQVERLVPKLREALPLIATLSPPLAALVREESPGIDVPKRCAVTRVDYAGDEGGIVCGLTFASNNRDAIGKEHFSCPSHLVFDRRQPARAKSPPTSTGTSDYAS